MGSFSAIWQNRIPKLLRGSEVASARANVQVLAPLSDNFDGVKAPVALQVRRPISERVLAAQFVLNFGKRIRHVLNFEGKEGTPAGGFRDPFHYLVAMHLYAANVGGDAVDDHLGALSHLDRFFARDVALVIFP